MRKLTTSRVMTMFLAIFLVVSLAPEFTSNASVMEYVDVGSVIVDLIAEPEEQPQDVNLLGKVVILDAGHGKGNTNIYAGYNEQVTMLRLAQKIKPLLESYGATVHMTRPTEDDVPLPVRVALINKWALQAVRDARLKELQELYDQEFYDQEFYDQKLYDNQDADRLLHDISEIDRLLGIIQSVIDDYKKNAPVYINYPFDYTYTRKIHPDWQKVFEYEGDPEVQDNFLMISLHSNATGKPIDTSKQGVDVYYISNGIKNNMNYYSNYSNEDRIHTFGSRLMDNMSEIGLRKRDMHAYYFFMIREHNVPGVLVENGFHTNSHDRAKLSDDDFLDKLAIVYVDTILDYWSLQYFHIP